MAPVNSELAERRESAQIENADVPTVLPSPPESNHTTIPDSDLALIADVWADLPKMTRGGIVPMVQATQTSG